MSLLAKGAFASAAVALGVAGQASAQNFCSGRDGSFVVYQDCDWTDWEGIVWWTNDDGQSGSAYVGHFSGRNACDAEGLGPYYNCDGSTRPFAMYRATKDMRQWSSWGWPPTVRVWWVIMDQYLHYESCQTPEGEPAYTVTNYSFPFSTVEYWVYCN